MYENFFLISRKRSYNKKLHENGDEAYMLSKTGWNIFKRTGDINTFLEFIETKNIDENLLEEENGNNQNESYYFKRK